MIKKIATLIFCEIIGFFLFATPLFYKFKNDANYSEMPEISSPSMILPLLNWYCGILMILGFAGIVLSLIFLIIFRNSDKKLFVKHTLIYSLITTAIGFIVLAIMSANMNCLDCADIGF